MCRSNDFVLQAPGESYDQYRTALRKLAEGCEFDRITPEEILRDRLVFGIRDAKVRERLLRENNLTLKKTDDLCHTAESMSTEMKAVETDNAAASSVAAVGSARRKSGKVARRKDNERKQECKYCGKTHNFTSNNYAQHLESHVRNAESLTILR